MLQTANADLEEQVTTLEKELEAATETGFELNRLLQDFLTSQNTSETMMKSVEHLQKQLDSQQNTITSLTKSRDDKNLEVSNTLWANQHHQRGQGQGSTMLYKHAALQIQTLYLISKGRPLLRMPLTECDETSSRCIISH